MLKSVFFYCLLFAMSINVWSQTEHLINEKINQPLAQFIEEAESKYQFKAFYKTEWIVNLTIKKDFQNKAFIEALNEVLNANQLSGYFFDEQTFVIIPRPDFRPEQRGAPVRSDNELVSIGVANLSSGDKATLSGFVVDAQTGLGISSASVYAMDQSEGVSTNESGFYQIDLPLGKQRMLYSFVGYENAVVTLDIQSNGAYNMQMFDQVTELNSITVTSEAPDANVRSVDMGVESLDIQQVKKLPVLMGEVDIIKSLVLLPGVTTVGEGAGGFNVRGGSVGENLILQDGSEIFNASHLFGFFSTFNPDLVEQLTLYKAGGIQADQGGRLSSILDVRLKNGDKKEFHGRGGIGSLMTRLAIETPIIKEKVSLSLGGRMTYSDWLLRQYDDIDLQQSEASFADLNAKLSIDFSEKDRLSLSGYWSEDRFKLANDTLFTYGTQLSSLNWSHAFSDRLSSNTHFNIGKYTSDVKDEVGDNQFEMNSQIDYGSIIQDFGLELNDQHDLKFGLKFSLYDVYQGDIKPLGGSLNTAPLEIPKERGLEWAVFATDQWVINDQLSINYGLRYSSFSNVGPGDVFVYQNGQPKSPSSIVDTLSYGSGETIQKYNGLEPRIGLRYQLNSESSLKAGYNRMRQYMHLVSNTAAITPVDVWQLSNTHIRPAISDQWALGYFRNFNNNSIEASVEVYYRLTKDILDFKGGANLLLNPTLEADLLQGQGRARGVELLLKKKEGKAKGWLSYTYSRTEIKAVSDFESETVNEGEYYPANYDQPHNLSLVFSYDFTKRITFTANFNYKTGRPITIPTTVYRIGPFNSFPDFSERNAYRIPDYHRLDLSLSIDQGFSKLKKLKGEWNFSIYNVYNRMNAYSIYFTETGRANKLSILGIIPSISYNFIF